MPGITWWLCVLSTLLKMSGNAKENPTTPSIIEPINSNKISPARANETRSRQMQLTTVGYCLPMIVPPRNGFLISACSNGVGSTCSFGCLSGFSLMGSPTTTCLPDTRIWSSPPPLCISTLMAGNAMMPGGMNRTSSSRQSNFQSLGNGYYPSGNYLGTQMPNSGMTNLGSQVGGFNPHIGGTGSPYTFSSSYFPYSSYNNPLLPFNPYQNNLQSVMPGYGGLGGGYGIGFNGLNLGMGGLGGGQTGLTPLIATGLLGIPILGTIPYRPPTTIIQTIPVGMPGLQQQVPDSGIMIGPTTGMVNPGVMPDQMLPGTIGSIPGNNLQGVIVCPTLMPPINGMRAGQCERAVPGGACMFSCMPGFVLTGFPILTCTATGQWSPMAMPPNCQPQGITVTTMRPSTTVVATTTRPTTTLAPVCPALASPVNGVARGTCINARNGAICNFSCFQGSILSGIPVLTCNNGVWSSPAPICRGTVGYTGGIVGNINNGAGITNIGGLDNYGMLGGVGSVLPLGGLGHVYSPIRYPLSRYPCYPLQKFRKCRRCCRYPPIYSVIGSDIAPSVGVSQMPISTATSQAPTQTTMSGTTVG